MMYNNQYSSKSILNKLPVKKYWFEENLVQKTSQKFLCKIIFTYLVNLLVFLVEHFGLLSITTKLYVPSNIQSHVSMSI